MRVKLLMLFFISIFFSSVADDGSKLWLRYNYQEKYVNQISSIVFTEKGEIISQASADFIDAYKSITGKTTKATKSLKNNALVLVTAESKFANQFSLKDEINVLENEGFIIKSIEKNIIIGAKNQSGLLYGVYALLREMQMGNDISQLNVKENPKYDIRVLNHWDNLDGTVERGYAGYSIWWNRDEDFKDLIPSYKTYARANASIGINGTVLNNVNASPQVLTDEYLTKVAKYADLMRPFNVKVYLSVNFASPSVLGGLPTSDPLDKDVIKWWENKAKEIYAKIPDFGGFLVKANSEGQPGPMDFGCTHVDGANMLAKALSPFGGIVMWRAFVYEPNHPDRAGQAFAEFMPFDGKFDDNVIVQVKNGPVDFQPREPFSALFGAMQKTPTMLEFQITQEYLGFSSHLAYLSTMWKEVLDADTYAKGAGSTVAKTTDGSLFNHKLKAISAVSNIGRDVNWTGHDFAQSNWYAFGRLAWDYDLKSEDIAQEWVKMTFSQDDNFVNSVVDIMMRSREAIVNYMTPLGLHHLMGWSHHYGPEPWTEIEGARPDWLPKYYHRASEYGIGFNRSSTGTNSVDQYFSPIRDIFDNTNLCPEELLLWFHHLPWDYRLQNGLKLWDAIVYKYYAGVEEVKLFQEKWNQLEGFVDKDRFEKTKEKLAIQVEEAIWWRDACVLYFQTFSNMPIPEELDRPIHKLEELKKLKFDMKHHN